MKPTAILLSIALVAGLLSVQLPAVVLAQTESRENDKEEILGEMSADTVGDRASELLTHIHKNVNQYRIYREKMAAASAEDSIVLRNQIYALQVRVLEDVHELAEYFLKEYSLKYEKPFLKLTSRAMDKLSGYSWPGNVRELRHSIEKTVILCDGKIIEPGDLFLSKETAGAPAVADSLKLADVEKKVIIQAIEESRGNFSQAAKILDISRTTLYAKLKKYGL